MQRNDTAPTLSRLAADKLATSGLTEKDRAKCKIEILEAVELDRKLGVKVGRAGLLIPYLDLNGEINGYARGRFLEEPQGIAALTDVKTSKYCQSPGSVPHLYYSPLLKKSWKTVLNSDTPLCFTEGELKANAACKHGVPTVAIGGVNAWSKDHRPIPDFEALAPHLKNSRRVIIAFDSDVNTNTKVLHARNDFSDYLLSLGAVIYIFPTPSLPDFDKTGIDDIIVQQGGKAFTELILATVDRPENEYEMSREVHRLNTELIFVYKPPCYFHYPSGQRINRQQVLGMYEDQNFNKMVGTYQSGNLKGTPRYEPVNAAEEWLKSPARNKVDEIIYEPGPLSASVYEIKNGKLNQWQGWGCEPRKGSVELWLDLTRRLITNREEHNYFLQWCAYQIQHPGIKLKQAVLLHGNWQGTGKSLIGVTLQRIFGKSNFAKIDAANLHNRFNSVFEGKQFIHVEEVSPVNSNKYTWGDQVKLLITEEELTIERKHMERYVMRNCANYLFTSNHLYPIHLEEGDRRFFVIWVENKPEPAKYYRQYCNWLEKGGVEAIFYFLLHYDLTGFDPYAPAISTASKLELIEAGQSDVETWTTAAYQDLFGENLDEIDPIFYARLPNDLQTSHFLLTTEFQNLWRSEGGNPNVSIQTLALALSRAGFKKVSKQHITGVGKPWIIREEEDVLQNWTQAMVREEFRQLRHLDTPPYKKSRKNEKK